jgi:hypothetical protein
MSDVAVVSVFRALGLKWTEIWKHFEGKRPGVPSVRALIREYEIAVECYYFWSN